MGYNQLDYLKRCKIYGLWRAGHNQTQIAKEVGVHKSSISRELKKNLTFVRTKRRAAYSRLQVTMVASLPIMRK